MCSAWRIGSPMDRPVTRLQNWMIRAGLLSQLTVTILEPSGLKLALWRFYPSIFIGWPMALPVAASHTRTVFPLPVVTILVPSRLKIALLVSSCSNA